MRRSLLGATLCAMLLACGHEPPKPAALVPEDVCAMCKMAVSRASFAAQLAMPNGEALMFDDLGCLLDDARRDSARAAWVADYDSRAWVALDSCWLVHSDSVRTPMGGGWLAYADSARAAKSAVEWHGVITRGRDRWHRR